MKEFLLIAYGCVGVATLILSMVYRFKRKGDSWVDWFLAHEFGWILFAVLWPIFLPLLLRAMARNHRGGKDL